MFYIKFTLKDRQKVDTLRESEIVESRPSAAELKEKRGKAVKRFYDIYHRGAVHCEIQVIPDTYESDEAMVA